METTKDSVISPKHSLASLIKQKLKLCLVTSTNDNLNSLDGLRGFAAVLVLLFHIFYTIQKRSVDQNVTAYGNLDILNKTGFLWVIGSTGVQLFFILSGFLLFLPYARAILLDNEFPSSRKFYFRRALRILPAYWLTLVILVFLRVQTVLPLPKPSDTIVDLRIDSTLHFFLLHNWSFETYRSMNGAFWTMAVEVQFYVLLPLIAYFLFKFRNKVGVKIITVLGLSSSVWFGFVYWFVQTKFPSLENHLTILFTLAYLTFFSLGMVCSYFYVKVTQVNSGKNSFLFSKRASKWFLMAGVTALLVFFIVSYLQQISLKEEPYNWIIQNPLLAISYGSLLVATLNFDSTLSRFFSHPVMRFIGLISYSLYIWHTIIFSHFVGPFVEKFELHNWLLGVIGYIIGTILTVIPFSYIFYTFVERPFIKYRRAQRDQRVVINKTFV